MKTSAHKVSEFGVFPLQIFLLCRVIEPAALCAVHCIHTDTFPQKGRILMKMLFKQRFFSWLDSYDIYDENGNTLYTVKGQLSWGHCLKIFDADGQEVGTVKERVLTWLPQFEMYLGDRYAGCIRKEFTFFRPKFTVDCNGWQVDGEFFEWDYTVLNGAGEQIASVSKEVLHWTDTYVIDVDDPADALGVLMLVLAIDAEKCSRDSH